MRHDDPKIGDLVMLNGFGPNEVVMMVMSISCHGDRELWCQTLSNPSCAWNISLASCRLVTDEEALRAIRRALKYMGYW